MGARGYDVTGLRAALRPVPVPRAVPVRDRARAAAAPAPATAPPPPAAPPRHARRPRRRSPWLLPVGLAVLAGAVVGMRLPADAAHGAAAEVHALDVVVSDAMALPGDPCAATDYAGTFFDGATVTLADPSGTPLAEAGLTGAPRASDSGCRWDVTLDGVPAGRAYVLRVASGAQAYTFTYDATELAAREWSAWVSVVN